MNNLKNIFSEIETTEINIKKGMHLFREGEIAQKFFLVKKGRIKLYKLNNLGKMFTLRMAVKDTILGEIPLFQDGERKYVFDALALEDTSVYAVDYAVLEEYLNNHPSLAVEILKQIMVLLRKQDSKIRDLLFYGKKGALYSILIRMSNSYGRRTPEGLEITKTFTNQEMATFTGMTRENLNRMLSELKREGVISFNEKNIVIKDIEYLREGIHCLRCDKSICNMD